MDTTPGPRPTGSASGSARVCLDENAALAVLDGGLDAAARRGVEEHIDVCGVCRRLLAAAALTVDALAAAPPEAPVDAPAHALREGDMIDHYRVIRRLGSGGMGEVYLARDTHLGRKVALKRIRAGLLGSDEASARFRREAQATARFSHPHIVTIHAIGEHEGSPYLALEYVPGQSLRERLLASAGRDAMPLQLALRIGVAVAEALTEAHARGVLHRDVKPANVLMASDGRVRLVDFGLAALGAPRLRDALTTGAAGTPRSMAPEQWRGEPVTAATDVWGLGVLIWEVLAGRPPFEAATHEEQARLVCGEAAPEPLPPETPPALAELLRRCLQRDPSARPTLQLILDGLREHQVGARAEPLGSASPFRGLLPFRERHADRFFGREEERASLLERLEHQPVLPITGPSGVGKSSFVGAGILPVLRADGWVVVPVRLGRDPFGSLARALEESWRRLTSGDEARSIEREVLALPGRLSLELVTLADAAAAQVVLAVDQLEEVFGLVPDAAVQRAVLAAVCGAADDAMDPVRVIFTVREDFLGRIAAVPEARSALSQLTVLHSPGDRALRDILRRPVELCGFRYEDESMVDEMVAEVSDRAASLPMLEFAADALWQRRDEERRLLLRAEHDRLGGVVGALGRHADGVLDALGEAERGLARSLVLRMVRVAHTAAGPEVHRVPVPRGRLLDGLDESAADVLDRLVDARLLSVARTRDGDTEDASLELSHDALLVQWRSLRGWLEQGEAELVLRSELSQAAQTWQRRGRSPSALWTGVELAQAQRLVASGADPPSPDVGQFLSASSRAERARRRRARVLVGGALATLAAVALVLAVQRQAADAQRGEAERQRSEAERQRAVALREGAAGALAQGRMLEARAKLRMALEAEDSASGRALWWQLERDTRRWARPLDTVPHMVAVSPDGATVAVPAQDRRVHLCDVASGRVRALAGHDDQVLSLAFDGSRMATGGWDGSVKLWSDGEIRATLPPAGARMVRSVAFWPGGVMLAGAAHDGRVRVWDTSRPDRAPRMLDGHGGGVTSVAFSPDGQVLASGGLDHVVRLWDTGRWTARGVLEGHQAGVRAISFSPDGRLLASAGYDQQVRLWDAATGQPVRVLRGHAGTVWSVAFSPDGRRLASGGADRLAIVWDVASGERRAALRGHDADVYGVAFGADGELATASSDRSVRLWHLPPGDASPLSAHDGGIASVAFSPDGERIATASSDATVRLWDASTGAVLAILTGHDSRVRGVAFDVTGAFVASAGDDATLRLWDRDGGTLRRVLSGHERGVTSVGDDPSGRRLVSSGVDGTVRLWDVAEGRQERALTGHAGPVWTARVSHDGEQVLSASSDHTARVWHAETGTLLHTLAGHQGVVREAVFLPDGAGVVTASDDGTVRRWDLEAGTSRVVGGGAGRAYAVAAHPRGTHAATAHADHTARVWDLASGEAMALRGHRGEVNDVAFRADGGAVATVSDDRTLRLWRLPDGAPVWRAPLLRRGPATLYSHEGVRTLGAAAPAAPRAAWERAVLAARLADASDDGAWVCLVDRAGELHRWDVATDTSEGGRAVAATRLRATAAGCVTLAGGASLYGPAALRGDAPAVRLSDHATAIGVDDGVVLVADDAFVWRFDAAGVALDAVAVTAPVRALHATAAHLWLGHGDGTVSSVPRGAATAVRLEDTPSSEPLQIAAGPGDTVAVGFADGSVGLWHGASGAPLLRGRLHGAVVHLLVEGGHLYAASDLGAHLGWPLEVFSAPYCDFLRALWGHVPVTWDDGAAVPAAPPPGHRCHARGASPPAEPR